MSFLNRSATTSAAAANDLSKDITLSSPPEDSISSLSWSSAANILAVSSWDNKVRIYDVTRNQTGNGLAAIDFDGPALACGWSKDGKKAVGGGADKTAKLLDMGAAGSPAQQVAAHDAPIRSIKFFQPTNSNSEMLITGSWDKTVKYWDLRSPAAVATLQCKDKVYSMDVKDTLLVIATAELHTHLVDLNNPAQFFDTRPSPLKSQTRVVTCFNDGSAYATGSIEGRCGVQYVTKKDAPRNFAFRCHRSNPDSKSNVNVYSVNAISVHPIHNTFSTAGSDGSFHFWDKDAKNRLKGFTDVGGPISATAFNRDGTIFAYAVSYDWSKGHAFNTPQHVNKVMLHPVSTDECKPKVVTSRR
ncbi:WD40-repeat-containing domain protein [Halenospora varia]|nr:WD40-repeat-containing domain protein [Halenospora varia]